jgi:replication factor C large subunit
MINELWLEKYRPLTTKELVGINKNMETLIEWCNKFVDNKKNKEPAAILYGEAGTGKTSTAYVLANEYGWEIIEVNASDVRTYDEIKKKLYDASQTKNLMNLNAKKLIFIDEVDKLYTNEGKVDKSAERALIELMSKSKFPIIMACNVLFDVPMNVKNDCIQLQYKKMNIRTRLKLLKTIAEKEGFKPNIEALNEINGIKDTRTCINSLQIYCYSDVIYVPEEDGEVSFFEMVSTILDGKDSFEIGDITQKSGLTPPDALMWIDENIGRKYTGIDLFRGYEAISEADLFLKRAILTQNYDNWRIAGELMSTGVSLARTIVEKEKRFTKTEYPSYIKKMGQTKRNRNVMKTLAEKLSKDLHCSVLRFNQVMFPLIKTKAQTDLQWLKSITSMYDLNEFELMLLLETDKNDTRIKECLTPTFIPDAETTSHIMRKKTKVKSLFDYA